jgi:hypothetical protein
MKKPIKKYFKIIGLTIITFFVFSCNEKQKKIENQLDWLKGGNLHKVAVKDWIIADDKNKLATCADFVCNEKSSNKEKYTSDFEIRMDAISLKNCIDETIKEDSLNEYKISEIAMFCMVLKETK